MNWLTWRQHRSQAIAGYGSLAVIGVFILLTGMTMLNHIDSTGLSRCLALQGDCQDLIDVFRGRFNSLQFFALFVLLVPALIGVFWGAPLVAREVEYGTHRLAWTQSVSRTRWISSKLLIIGASTLAFAGLFVAAVNWWADPLLRTGWNRFEGGLFDQLGIVPVAYALFAFTLGVALGTAIKKTLPAIFATLAVFAAVRIPFLLFIRERLMTPKMATFGFASDQSAIFDQGHWILGERTIDAAGNVVSNFGGLSAETIDQFCPNIVGVPFPGKGELFDCFTRAGFRTEVLYQPADRFWAFQFLEAAIFVALSALLVAFIVRRVRRLS